MSEREQLQQRARDLAADRHAERRKHELQLAEYQYKLAQATGSLLARLHDLRREYAGTVRLALSGSATSVRIGISNRSSALQKPFAEVTVRAEGNGFYITDEIKNPERYDIPFKLLYAEDEVIELVKQLAAEFLVKGHATPYELPEWYSVLVTIASAIGCFAMWVAVALSTGLWGAIVGAIVMIGVFWFLRHVGPWIALVAIGLGGIGVVLAGAEWLMSQ